MRELMLKLLTYEPFEQIGGDEKDFIDALLANDNEYMNYPLYYELMDAFKQYVDSKKPDDRTLLVKWFHDYFEIKSDGKINTLHSKITGARTYYPVLFKKICVFSILAIQLEKEDRYLKRSEYSKKVPDNEKVKNPASNFQFFEDFGMRENILNKWHVSTRYVFLANRDTYSAFKIDRNGLKKPYLTRVIKQVYYESANQMRKYTDTAKKYELETFVDVFSATGTVAASVDAKSVIVNDIDAGASCFLFAFINYKNEVKKILADFHKDFVQEQINSTELYSEDELQYHYENYIDGAKSLKKQLDIEQMYDEQYYVDHNYGLSEGEVSLGRANIAIHRKFIKNVRNNYLAMELALDNWNKKYTSFDLSKLPANDYSDVVKDIVEYGAMWFFFWSIKKTNAGKEPFKTDISESSYADYISNVLGFAFRSTANYKNYITSRIDKMYDAKYFVERMNLLPKNISFGFDKKHNFFKYMKNAKVYNKSYDELFELLEGEGGRYFYYLDSPYFLTTDYKIPFQDAEHKKMLDILRDAPFHWLFSMQYYEGSTKNVKKVTRPSVKEYHPQIRDYNAYYRGFANEFVLDKKGEYWEVNTELTDESLEKLFVILFASTSSNEMMICNFDIRLAIKYGDDAVILPMKEFLKLQGQKGMTYQTIYDAAIVWRQNDIISNL